MTVRRISTAKPIEVYAHCSVCGFKKTYKIYLNNHGFYELPDAYCPDDLFLLNQEIKCSGFRDF